MFLPLSRYHILTLDHSPSPCRFTLSFNHLPKGLEQIVRIIGVQRVFIIYTNILILKIRDSSFVLSRIFTFIIKLASYICLPFYSLILLVSNSTISSSNSAHSKSLQFCGVDVLSAISLNLRLPFSI